MISEEEAAREASDIRTIMLSISELQSPLPAVGVTCIFFKHELNIVSIICVNAISPTFIL